MDNLPNGHLRERDPSNKVLIIGAGTYCTLPRLSARLLISPRLSGCTALSLAHGLQKVPTPTLRTFSRKPFCTPSATDKTL